jgi:hypothetical protein
MRMGEILSEIAPPAPRGASLYHGTSCLAAAEIIKTGIIHAANDGHGMGISMTDTWGSAEEFGLRKDSEDATFLAHHHQFGNTNDYEEDFQRSMQAYPHLAGVVIEMDAAKLAATYRIRAVDYSDSDWDVEEEWRVMTKTGVIIAPVLKAIHVKPDVIAWWIGQYPDRKPMLQLLLDHPLRR